MAHPLMFDEDDPLLAKVRAVSLALPGAQEKISHGHPAHFTTTVFCYYGAALKVDGEWVQHHQSAVVKVEPDEWLALQDDPRCYVPSYYGTRGWIGIDLDADTDWDEVAELIEGSYRLTAPARLVKELDAQRAGQTADRARA